MAPDSGKQPGNLLSAFTRLRPLVALLVVALAGCGDSPSLEQRLDEIQEEIREVEPGLGGLNRRLYCRDRHTGDPPAIQACIQRGV